MKREEAIAKFGVSYYTQPVWFEEAGHPRTRYLLRGIHNIKVIERLGAENESHPSPESAVRAATSEVMQTVQARLDQIAQWKRTLGAKFAMAAAWSRLSADQGERLKAIRETEQFLRGLQKSGLVSQTERLPDEITLPVILELGCKIYRVEAYYLDRAMDVAENPVTEHAITGMKLRDSWAGAAHSRYDYLIEYRLDNGERFTLPADRETDDPIETNIVNYKYFLTEKGAQNYMRSVAQRITDAMKPYLQGPG